MPGANAMPSRMTAMKPKGGKRFRGMSIRPADSGGYIVNHEFQQGVGPENPYIPDEQHIMGDEGALHAHVRSMFPLKGATPMAAQANRTEPGEQA